MLDLFQQCHCWSDCQCCAVGFCCGAVQCSAVILSVGPWFGAGEMELQVYCIWIHPPQTQFALAHRLYVNWRFLRGIEAQFLALQKGFNEVIPQHLLKTFDEKELEVSAAVLCCVSGVMGLWELQEHGAVLVCSDLGSGAGQGLSSSGGASRERHGAHNCTSGSSVAQTPLSLLRTCSDLGLCHCSIRVLVQSSPRAVSSREIQSCQPSVTALDGVRHLGFGRAQFCQTPMAP